VIQEVLKHHPEDTTKIDLLFANVSTSDILMRQRLDSFAAQYANFEVHARGCV